MIGSAIPLSAVIVLLGNILIGVLEMLLSVLKASIIFQQHVLRVATILYLLVNSLILSVIC